jgi:hypothetical protein
VVFIPQKVADRLKEYIEQNNIEPNQRIFQLTTREPERSLKRQVSIRYPSKAS